MEIGQSWTDRPRQTGDKGEASRLGASMARLYGRSPPANMTFFRQPFALVGTVGALCLLVVISVRFMAAGPGIISTLWITSGVAVVTWLKGGRGLPYNAAFAALVFMALMAGELILGNPPHRAIIFVGLNLFEIMLAVALLRYVFPRLDVHMVKGQVKLILTCMVASLPSALVCGALVHHGASDGYLGGVRMWWLGHGLGMLMVLATGFSLSGALNGAAGGILTRGKHRIGRLVEAVAMLLVLVAASLLVFDYSYLALGFAILPLLLLIAIRMRVLGTAVGLLVVSVIAIKGTMAGSGPYHNMEVGAALAMAQMLILFGYSPVLVVAALLDERDALAERARSGRQKAEEASAAKSRLLANVAHEIKSPVGGIIGIAEMWASGHLGVVTMAQKDMAQMMVRTGRQIENLAHDLLDVSQAESGAVRIELRPTDVAGVLHDVSHTISMMPEAVGLKLDIQVAETGLKVVADSQRLTQIMVNLGSNAVKYAREGGFVRFSATRREDGIIRLAVEDGGQGLTPEKQVQLFEPFNRLGLERSSIEGHGIGLALSKRLAELQKGRMGVASVQGHGASFWVELPEAY